MTAESDYVTIYIRAWKKWGVANEEIDINFDSISLVGPSPYYQQPVQPIYPVAARLCGPVQSAASATASAAASAAGRAARAAGLSGACPAV